MCHKNVILSQTAPHSTLHTKQIHTFIISGHLKNSLFRLDSSCAVQLSKNSFKFTGYCGYMVMREEEEEDEETV